MNSTPHPSEKGAIFLPFIIVLVLFGFLFIVAVLIAQTSPEWPKFVEGIELLLDMAGGN